MLFVEKPFQKQKQAFALQMLRETNVLLGYDILKINSLQVVNKILREVYLD